MDEKGFTPGNVLAKNTLLNLLGMVLPLIAGVISIPFAIKGLTTEGFGILSIVWVILSYFGLLDFGLSRATTKFVAEMLGKKEHKILPSIMWTAFILSFVLGIIGATILFLLIPYLTESLLKIPANFINETKISFQWFTCALPFILFSTSLRGILGAAQRFDLVNIVLIPVNILNFMFPALSLPFGFSLSIVIILIVLSRIIALFFYFYFCLIEFPVLKTKPFIDIQMAKKLLTYGGWITITNIISPILVYLDRFFIGSIISVNAVTFYTAPYEAISRLRIIPIAIMTTFFPEFSAMTSINYRERVQMLISRSIKYVLISTGIVALLLFFYAYDILQLWLGDQIAKESAIVFKIFALGIAVNSLAYIPFNVFQGIGKPDLPAKFHLIEFPLYIVLLFVLAKSNGINGVAIAWFARVVFDFLLLYIWTLIVYPDLFKSFNVNKIWHEILLLIVFSMCLLLSNFISTNLIIKTIFILTCLIVFTILIWYYIFDVTERKLVNSFFQRLFFSKTTESYVE